MTFLIRLIALITAGAAYGGDDLLYDALPDPDASFVRVIAAQIDRARIADTVARIDGGTTPYLAVDAGPVDVVAGHETVTLEVAPKARFTVALTAGGAPIIFEDAVVADATRAGLLVYNLAQGVGAVDLHVPAAQANAVSALAEGSAGSVPLRAPLTLDFMFQSAGTDLAGVTTIDLRRNETVTVILTGTADQPTALWVANQYSQ